MAELFKGNVTLVVGEEDAQGRCATLHCLHLENRGSLSALFASHEDRLELRF
jgi:hypothetical protein